jgi:hypothetical protein
MSEQLRHPAEQAIQQNFDLKPHESGLIIAETAEKITHSHGRYDHIQTAGSDGLDGNTREVIESRDTTPGTSLVVAKRKPGTSLVIAKDRPATTGTEHPKAIGPGKHDEDGEVVDGILVDETYAPTQDANVGVGGGKEPVFGSTPNINLATGGGHAVAEPARAGNEQSVADKPEPELWGDWEWEDAPHADQPGRPAADEKTVDLGIEAGDYHERLFAGQVNIKYDRDEYGRTQTGVEFTQDGSIMDWDKFIPTMGSPRDVILHTGRGYKYWIRDGEIIDLSRMERGNFKHPRELVLATIAEDGLEPAVLGKGWQMTPDLLTGSIAKVEVKYKLAADNEANDEVLDTLESRGADPFKVAEALMKPLQNIISPPTEIYEPVSSGKFSVLRDRARNMMGRAATALRGFKEKTPPAARQLRQRVGARRRKMAAAAGEKLRTGAVIARNKLADIKEAYDDLELKERRRKMVAEISGALILSGTVLYEELKPNLPTVKNIKEAYNDLELKEKRRKMAAVVAMSGAVALRRTVPYERPDSVHQRIVTKTTPTLTVE